MDIDGETPFITTEFIEGEPLRDRLRRGRIPLPEALEVATQVADALAAAHREGIVHRDIKPENILLRPDGYVKVVDFGLAKLAEVGAGNDSLLPTGAVVETSAGVILGTVAYMSPEQARGLPVDARTDVWSLGVVLYEMIAERRPFSGATSSDVIAHILQRDPPKLAAFAPGVTGEVELVVETALAKEADERYQSARDLANVLKRVRRHVDTNAEIERALPPEPHASAPARDARRPSGAIAATSSATPPTPETSGTRVPASTIKWQKAAVTATLALTILVVGGAVYFRHLFSNRPQQLVQSFEHFQIARLTSSSRILDAAISPDGRYVVHNVDDGPGQSLWVRQVNTSSNVEIVRTADVSYLGMTFSNDGDYIYYVSRALAHSLASLYRIPVLGGAPRKLIDDVNTSITFSPDGSRIAFIRDYADGSSAMIVSNADGTGQRRLATLELPSTFASGVVERIGPAWSPDGNLIASTIDLADASGRHSEVGIVDVKSGKLTPLTSRSWYMIRRVAWVADGSGLLAAVADRSSAYSAQQVWRIPYPAGEPRRITKDLSNYGGVSMTSAGRAFVTVQTSTTSEIWVAPHGNPSAASVLTPSRTTFDGTYGVSWTPDGQIVYSSAATGTFDLWIMKADGSERRPLTANAAANLYPDVSRDGRTVVLTSDRESNVFQIWRIGIDGTGMRSLTRDETAWGPRTSTDGSVIYGSADRIWRVSLDGGTALRLTNKTTSRPAVSPDGKLFVCSYREPDTAPSQLAVYEVGDAEPRQLFDIPATADRQAQWAPDGRSVQYIDTRDGVSNIWNLDLNGSRATQVTRFKTDRIFAFAWSRDGTRLALSRGAVASDVVLVTLDR